MNRDIRVLAGVSAAMSEIELLEEQMEWERSRLSCLSRYPSGMPTASRTHDGLDRAYSIIDGLERDHAESCAQYRRRIRAAERILSGIESDTLRAFVKMRYVFGVPDTKIRESLNLTRRGFERAKKAVEEAPSMREVKWQERILLSGAEEAEET